jgi:TRAP transporter TAXI family solute receptor
MKKFTFTMIAGLIAAGAAFAHAETLTITTGSKKGAYFEVGQKIASQFKGSKVVTSKGSVQNFDRLIKGEANVAIAQKDAYRWYTKRHPEASEKIDLVGDLYPECVFLVVKKDGKVQDDGDLQKEGVTIAVGKRGSGSQVSWDYMTDLEPAFKKATSIPKGGTRVLAKVASGQYDAALFVMQPDPNRWLFKTVKNNPDLEFAPITDWDLNDKFEGKPIYEFKKVDVEKGFFGDSVKTICTTASVFINSDLDDDAADDLSDLLLNHKKFLTGEK